MHDIQSGWKKGLVATTLAFDIKGFFDHVHHDRLVEVLRLAGFPQEIRAWVRSFVSSRQVSIRVNGTNTEPSTCSIGIPQGSPLSPILAALYTAPVIEISISKNRSTLYFYVDDGMLVAFSKSIPQNIRQLQEDFQVINSALQAIGLSVDHTKFEVMHFTRAKSPELLPIRIVLSPDNVLTISPNPVMRWLGFFLDRKLEFKEHVRIMCNRAMSKIQALTVLGNSVRGMNHANRRLAYKTIVLPVLTYGAALWYTGVRQKGLTKQMAKIQNAGLRLILGTFRTSPTAALHHIGSILPIPLLLERTLDNMAICLRTLPRHAQPIVRLAEPWNRGPVQGPTHSKSRTKKLTNLQQLATRAHFTLDIDERTNPYATPPWQLGNIWGCRLTFSSYAPRDKDVRKQLIRNIRECESKATVDPTVINIFTDGSRHLVGDEFKTGAAFTAFYLGKEVSKGLLGLGACSDNFDGEMFALAHASRHLHQILQDRPQVQRVRLFADNTSAISVVYDTSPHPSQDASVIFRRSIDKLLSDRQDVTIDVLWSPGHSGIRGNERADQLAKQAATQRSFIGTTVAWAKARTKATALEHWVQEWKELPKNSPSSLSLTRPPSTRLDKFHRTFTGNRRTYSHTVQALLGHAFTGEYFARFVPRLHAACPCDDSLLQTRAHILVDCPLHEHARDALREASSNLSVDFLLGTQKGIMAVAKFISRSTAFRPPDSNNS